MKANETQQTVTKGPSSPTLPPIANRQSTKKLNIETLKNIMGLLKTIKLFIIYINQ